MWDSRSVRRCARALLSAVVAVSAVPVLAGKADVVEAQATREADGSYLFIVTVRHADTGWEHFADRFEVVGPDGAVIATRVLLHPHVDEQPFTRELSGVRIPAHVHTVVVRAHDNVHGLGGSEVTVRLGE